MQQFINHNGDFLPADQPVVKANNRAFCYGDALFETIRITNYRPQFLKKHLQRLYTGMKVLKMGVYKYLGERYNGEEYFEEFKE